MGLIRHSKHITRGPRWHTLRLAVLERDGFKCRFCGKNRGRLEIGSVIGVGTTVSVWFPAAEAIVTEP